MIETRGMEANDVAFVMSTWLRGLRFGNDYFGSMDSDAYYASKKEEVSAILGRSDISVRVACASDDRELILGYLVAQIGDVDHSAVWAWTRPAVRQQGVMTKLCEGLRIRSVGNVTKIGDEIRQKKNLPFRPIVLKWNKGE